MTRHDLEYSQDTEWTCIFILIYLLVCPRFHAANGGTLHVRVVVFAVQAKVPRVADAVPVVVTSRG